LIVGENFGSGNPVLLATTGRKWVSRSHKKAFDVKAKAGWSAAEKSENKGGQETPWAVGNLRFGEFYKNNLRRNEGSFRLRRILSEGGGGQGLRVKRGRNLPQGTKN